MRKACTLLALWLAHAAVALAQDSFGGSLGITSDYVYRGLTLSQGRTAYQAGAHAKLLQSWRIGAWASTIENRANEGTPIEAIYFLSYGWNVRSTVSMRAAYAHYDYFGSATPYSNPYDQLSLAATFYSRLTIALDFSPNTARYNYGGPPREGNAVALEATYLQPLWRQWLGTIGGGYYDVSELYDDGYAYWHVGVVGPLGPLELELLHIDSDATAARIFGPLAGARWSGALRWRF